jgi:hypothetical protein
LITLIGSLHPVSARARRGLRSLIILSASTCLLPLLVEPLLAQNPSVTSPDGRLRLQFAAAPTSQSAVKVGFLVYSLFFNGQPLLRNSALSLSLTGSSPLGQNVTIVSAALGSGIDDYHEVAGRLAPKD